MLYSGNILKYLWVLHISSINIYASLMYELKKIKRYLGVNLLGAGPRLMKEEFTGPQSHKG